MGTFAYYLVAAMLELNPPSEWEDIAERALIDMKCSEGRKAYCTDELRKALDVAIRFGTIKKLDDKYYLYEYGVVGAEGDITYQLEHILLDDLDDSENDADIDMELSSLTHELFKETQLSLGPITERDLQLAQSSLVGPITRDFLQSYANRMEDEEEEEGTNMEEPMENDDELVQDDDISNNGDLEEYEMSTFSVSEEEIPVEMESSESDSDDELLLANNKRKYTSAPDIMMLPKKPRYNE